MLVGDTTTTKHYWPLSTTFNHYQQLSTTDNHKKTTMNHYQPPLTTTKLVISPSSSTTEGHGLRHVPLGVPAPGRRAAGALALRGWTAARGGAAQRRAE